MINAARHKEKIRNVEHPFTELFSLLKRYKNTSKGIPTLAYKTNELRTINQHAENAMEIMLQGLQDLGQVIGHFESSKSELLEEHTNIGFLVSAVSNLTQALNALRSDSNYVLENRMKNLE